MTLHATIILKASGEPTREIAEGMLPTAPAPGSDLVLLIDGDETEFVVERVGYELNTNKILVTVR